MAHEGAQVLSILRGPPPVRNIAGTQREQQQAVLDYLFGNVEHSSAASPTGDLEHKINYLMANAGRGGKLAGNGHFLIPTTSGTTPVAPVTLTAGGSTYAYGSWAQLIASVVADLYIVGIYGLGTPSTQQFVQIGTGAAASEVVKTEVRIPAGATAGSFMPLNDRIPVAAGTRIAARYADSDLAGRTCTVQLLCERQVDLSAI